MARDAMVSGAMTVAVEGVFCLILLRAEAAITLLGSVPAPDSNVVSWLSLGQRGLQFSGATWDRRRTISSLGSVGPGADRIQPEGWSFTSARVLYPLSARATIETII